MMEKIKEFWNKGFWNKVLIIFVILFLIGVVGNSGEDTTSQTTKNEKAKVEEKQPKKVDKKEYKYLTELENPIYDNSQPYMFACGKEDYDGDVFEPGKYKIYTEVSDVDLEQKKQPRIFDVWITKKEPKNFNDLGEPDFSVGGFGKVKENITLKKGDYIIVKGIVGANEKKISGGFQMKLIK